MKNVDISESNFLFVSSYIRYHGLLKWHTSCKSNTCLLKHVYFILSRYEITQHWKNSQILEAYEIIYLEYEIL